MKGFKHTNRQDGGTLLQARLEANAAPCTISRRSRNEQICIHVSPKWRHNSSGLPSSQRSTMKAPGFTAFSERKHKLQLHPLVKTLPRYDFPIWRLTIRQNAVEILVNRSQSCCCDRFCKAQVESNKMASHFSTEIRMMQHQEQRNSSGRISFHFANSSFLRTKAGQSSRKTSKIRVVRTRNVRARETVDCKKRKTSLRR